MRRPVSGYPAVFNSFFVPSILACLLTAMVGIVLVAPASAASKPLFGREVIVDNQRITGEPSISIDGQDRIYVSTPYGF